MKKKAAALLTVNSSPKPNSKTEALLALFENNAKSLGAEIKRVNLYEEESTPVSGKLGKSTSPYNRLQQAVLACDGVVIATPTYWFNVPGILKNFIDNLTQLEEDDFLLEGKVAGFIVHSPQGGEIGALQAMALPLNHMGVVLPPYCCIFYRGPQDDWVEQDCKDLAKRMLVQIEAQKQLGMKWDKW